MTSANHDGTCTIIDLAADRVLANGELIDQAIGRVFDHLAYGTVELRIRVVEQADDSDALGAG
jgi:hypothetical protein